MNPPGLSWPKIGSLCSAYRGKVTRLLLRNRIGRPQSLCSRSSRTTLARSASTTRGWLLAGRLRIARSSSPECVGRCAAWQCCSAYRGVQSAVPASWLPYWSDDASFALSAGFASHFQLTACITKTKVCDCPARPLSTQLTAAQRRTGRSHLSTSELTTSTPPTSTLC